MNLMGNDYSANNKLFLFTQLCLASIIFLELSSIVKLTQPIMADLIYVPFILPSTTIISMPKSINFSLKSRSIPLSVII